MGTTTTTTTTTTTATTTTPSPRLVALLFRCQPLLHCYFMILLSITTTRSAARGRGNPCRWSKVARPPTHTTNHTSHHITSSHISCLTCHILNSIQPLLPTPF